MVDCQLLQHGCLLVAVILVGRAGARARVEVGPSLAEHGCDAVVREDMHPTRIAVARRGVATVTATATVTAAAACRVAGGAAAATISATATVTAADARRVGGGRGGRSGYALRMGMGSGGGRLRSFGGGRCGREGAPAALSDGFGAPVAGAADRGPRMRRALGSGLSVDVGLDRGDVQPVRAGALAGPAINWGESRARRRCCADAAAQRSTAVLRVAGRPEKTRRVATPGGEGDEAWRKAREKKKNTHGRPIVSARFPSVAGLKNRAAKNKNNSGAGLKAERPGKRSGRTCGGGRRDGARWL